MSDASVERHRGAEGTPLVPRLRGGHSQNLSGGLGFCCYKVTVGGEHPPCFVHYLTFRTMRPGATTNLGELIALYKVRETRHSRIRDEGIRLLEQFCLDNDGLARLRQTLAPLRATLLNLSKVEKDKRAVKDPRGSTPAAMVKLVGDIARSDGCFKHLSDATLLESTSLGAWLREARLRGVELEGSLIDLGNIKAQMQEGLDG